MKPRFFIFIFLFCFIFLTFSIKANAQSDYIKYVTTSLGENERIIHINYHTNASSSFVTYSTSSDLAGGATLNATHKTWSYPSDEEKYGFDERMIARVELENLALDTTYYYQITAGNAQSEIYSFTTAMGTTYTVFGFVTDSQSSGSGYEKVNTLMENLLLANKNIRFMFMTGDIIDRGGMPGQWDDFFKYVTVTKKMPFATIPGNHEYYLTSSGTYVSPEVYNQFFNNPKNGPTERLNSTYFFKYNDILFIMLDTIKKELFEEQRAWFDRVILENPSQYIIVGMHSTPVGAGVYASDGKRMMEEWGSLFERHAVDLVIGGHEHLFAYTNPLTKGKVDPDFGVTYLINPAGGGKQYNVYEQYEDQFAYTQNINYAGAIVQVIGNNLTFTLYNQAGDVQHEFTLKARRPAPQPSSNYKLKYELRHDTEAQMAYLSWEKAAFGNIRKVQVTNEFGLNVTKVVSTPKVLEMSLGGAYDGNVYHYHVVFTMANGEIIEKDLTLGETESEPGTNPDPKPSTGCQMGPSVLGLLFVPLALLIRKKEE